MYLIALVRTFGMILKSNDERLHTYFIPDISEKASGFSLLSMMLTVIFNQFFNQGCPTPLSMLSFVFLFFFLRAAPTAYEVPRLGVQSEL